MTKNNDDIPEKMQLALFTEILKRPENHQCADCSNKSPTWASINFGVFLCIRCSGIHRQLGPHITRVKSSKLDKWKRDQAEIMTSVGNKLANDYYEYKLPKDFKRLDVNSSPEECTRFVREKYIKKSYAPPKFKDPVTELLLNKENGLKIELVVPKENLAHLPMPQQAQQGFGKEVPLAMRKKSFSLEETAKDVAKKQTSAPIVDVADSNQQQQSLPDDLFANNSAVPQNVASDDSAKPSSAFEFDFSAIQSKDQSQTQGVLGELQQNPQVENKAPEQVDIKKLYQQYNNPYGANPMMMGAGYNPYMAQQFNGYPQQMGGFPQMNQMYQNQFNNGMYQMNPGMMNPTMMNLAMQQGYNPQMNGGFPQGMNNMQQSYNNNF